MISTSGSVVVEAGVVVVAEVVVVTASVAEDVVCSVLSSISCGVVLLSDSSILVAMLVSDFAFELDTESVLVSSSQPEKRNDADRKIASKDIGLRFIRVPPKKQGGSAAGTAQTRIIRPNISGGSRSA